MNIAFFLLPKEHVICLNETSTMRQALERMEYHRYTAVPIINKDGKYLGTITEGDLLWKLKSTPNLTFENCNKFPILDVPRRMYIEPVRIYAQVDDLFSKAIHQNFVPVIDDQDIFIGIIRRSDIIKHLFKQTVYQNK